MMLSIYALVDKTTNRMRYVGMTVKAPEIRLREHLGWARRGLRRNHRDSWIRKIGADNVGVRHLAWAPTRRIAGEAERAWIALLSPGLTNMTEGGDGGLPGFKQSVASVEQRAAANRGKTRSPEQRARISAALKGRPAWVRTPESRANLSAALKGRACPWLVGLKRPWTAENRANQSQAQQARRARERGES